jgi:hypothetical protein
VTNQNLGPFNLVILSGTFNRSIGRDYEGGENLIAPSRVKEIDPPLL